MDLVDVKNQHLIDTATFCSYACALGPADVIRLFTILHLTDAFHHRLLAEFPALTQPTFTSATARHGVEHHIVTGLRPRPTPGPSQAGCCQDGVRQHGAPADCLPL